MAKADRDQAQNKNHGETANANARTSSVTQDRPALSSRRSEGRYSSVLPTETGEPGPGNLRRSTTGGWMSGRSRDALGLKAAFERAGEESDSTPKDLRRSGRETLGSNSRIPRPNFYPRDSPLSSSRKQVNTYGSPDPEERSASAPTVSDIKNKGLRPASPSPLPRPRGRSTGDGERLQTITRRPLHFKSKSGSILQRHLAESELKNEYGAQLSSGSSISGLSAIDDSTEDEFDRKMKNFFRDQERLAAGPSSQTGSFKKENGQGEDSEKGTKCSPLSNVDPEPPVTVPRTWGSKARKNNGWLTKIISPDASQDLKTVAPPSNDNFDSKDVPLPSIEDRRSLQEPTPPASRPNSAKTFDISPEKSKLWDADLDFTARSLQVSSPNFVVKRTKLDEVREAEAQSLSSRALARSKLEEIKERNSEERSISPETLRAIVKTEPDVLALDKHDPIHERTVLEEEGERIPGTPITIFSGSTRPHTSDRRGLKDSVKDNGSGDPQAKHDQYRDTLRSLARLASASASPNSTQSDNKSSESSSKADEEKGEKLTEKPLTDPIPLGPVTETQRKRYSTSSDAQKSDIDPEERIAQEKKLFDLPDEKPEKDMTRPVSPAHSNSEDLETPKAKRNVLSMPTPKVTGAYIETPAPVIQRLSTIRPRASSFESKKEIDEESEKEILRGPGQRASSDDDHKDPGPLGTERLGSSKSAIMATRPRSRPPLLNTAKPASVSDDLNNIRKEIGMDDSTLDDFDAVITAEQNRPDNTTILEDLPDLEYDRGGRPLTQKEKERILELLALDRMNKSLKSTSTSITEAKRGIERLERKVSASAAASKSSANPDIVHHHNHTDCPQCAAGSNGFHHLTIPVPRLIARERSKAGRRKLTWLGLITLIFSVWYVSESVMCEFYCHPRYASVNTWSPSDPFFPYAIPTKLDQWTGEVVSGAVIQVSNAVWNIWAEEKSPRHQTVDSRDSTGPARHGGWMSSPVKSSTVDDDGWEDVESSMFEDETI